MKSHTLSDLSKFKSRFDQMGICHYQDVFDSDLVAEMQIECDRLWNQQEDLAINNLRIGLRTDLNGATVLDRLDPVADISTLFDSLNKSTVLTGLAESLLDQDVQVMKEKLIFKRPGTCGFGLHRDEPYFSSSGATGEEMVSLTVLLDDFTSVNGPMQFYPDLRKKGIRAPVDEPRDIDPSETNEYKPFVPLGRKGDILAFDGLIPHCSDYNRSSGLRRIYMVTYIPASYENGRDKYYQQRLSEQRAERHHARSGELIFR